ncbi:WD repeat-containing protein 43, partial [Stegodyphus mimosarum]
MSKCLSKNKHILLSAVTEEGFVQLFEHVLNGVIKKPLLPKMTIHIVSKPNGRDSKPQTIPIIASKVCDDTGFCIVAYGCHKNPIFEKVNISECPKNLTLVRNKCLCCTDCSEKRNLEVCSSIENGFKSKDVSPLNGSFKSKKQKLLDFEQKYTDVTEDKYAEQTDALKTKIILNETRLPSLPSNMKKRLKITEDEFHG